jgi:hypothetical protein
LLYANAEHGSLLDRHPAFRRLWMGPVAMTAADHVADLAAISQQKGVWLYRRRTLRDLPVYGPPASRCWAALTTEASWIFTLLSA